MSEIKELDPVLLKNKIHLEVVWSTFVAKQIWRMLLRVKMTDMLSLQQSTQQEFLHLTESTTLDSHGCTDPFVWRQRTWVKEPATNLHCRHNSLGIQGIPPRLVAVVHALTQPVMVPLSSSFGKTSSVKGKSYSQLPLLASSVLVSRCASAVRHPLHIASTCDHSRWELILLRGRELQHTHSDSSGAGTHKFL